MSKLKTFYGSGTHVIPGLPRGNRMINYMVTATSQRAAHAALVAAGVKGWSFYAFRNFWSEGNDDPQAMACPGAVFYRPDGIHVARWVRWGEPYPVDEIPEKYRS